MCPGLYWWTWSPGPWIQSDQDHLDRSSDQTTLFLVSATQVEFMSISWLHTDNMGARPHAHSTDT